MTQSATDLDALIVGGGAAGLWLLDEMRRAGWQVLLVEKNTLGSGQTIAAQGIIHGGLKYTLDGALSQSARAIREMPALWRGCLSGQREPDLSTTRVLSERCHMWRTSSIGSRVGMVGAKAGLRSIVMPVPAGDRPAALANCPGDVFSINEQVIDTASFVRTLFDRNRNAILHATQLAFHTTDRGVDMATIRHADVKNELRLQPGHVILTAGEGNAGLRDELGLPAGRMQRRPLHMVMVRGQLPALHGHCVDVARTRVTITSNSDSAGRCVWQIGGQIAEDGVQMNSQTLIERAINELRDVLPAVDFDDCEWATYRVDRAEHSSLDGKRPAGVQFVTDGNVITAWPTKLALVPELAKLIINAIPPSTDRRHDALVVPTDWPRPDVALPPWEIQQAWVRLNCH